MNVSKYQFLFIGLLTYFSFLSVVRADFYHYKNILVGDRAATMGGAYVGIADDSSGTFFNPSGIVFSTGDSVSGSANVYHIQHSSYGSAIGTNDWFRDSSALLPNFFSLIKKFDKSSIGISFVVPDSFVGHQDQTFTNLSQLNIDRYVLNLHSEDTTYLFGASYAYRIHPKLSLGLTLFYSFRKYRIHQSQLVEFSDGTEEWTGLNASHKEGGLLPKFGIMWSPIKPISIGFTISKTQLVSSLMEQFSNSKEQSSTDTAFAFSSTKYKQKLPIQMAWGVAYFVSPFLLFAFDVDLYTSADYRRRVINYSAGSEYFLNETNALRLGFFTNFSNQAPLSTSVITQNECLNLYGTTVGYTLYGKSSSITLGLVYSMGSGDAQVYDNSSILIDVSRYSLTGLIAASYGF